MERRELLEKLCCGEIVVIKKEQETKYGIYEYELHLYPATEFDYESEATHICVSAVEHKRIWMERPSGKLERVYETEFIPRAEWKLLEWYGIKP